MDPAPSVQQELEQLNDELHRRSISGPPVDPALLVRRANLLCRLYRWEEAGSTTKEALQLQQELNLPEDPELLLLQALGLWRHGGYEDSIAVTRRAEALYQERGLPVSPRVQNNIGVALLRMGQITEALAAFDEVERVCDSQGQPVEASVFANRGIALFFLGRFDDALAAFAEAEKRYPEQGQPVWPGLSGQRGRILGQLGRFDEAIAGYDEAERRFNEQGLMVHPANYINRGMIYGYMGRYQDALAAYARAEELCREQGMPISPAIESGRASIYGSLGQYEDALAAYAKAEGMIREQGLGEDWQLYFRRAITLYESGHQADATREIYRAIALCGRLGIESPGFLLETLQDWMTAKSGSPAHGQQAGQPEAVQSVPDAEKLHDVFICYRRNPGHPYSMLLQSHMEFRQKKVFRDQDSLSSGRFEDSLQEAIRYSRHMLVLLTEGFFERTAQDGNDVVRKEIATALHCGTHIIPVMMEGFVWPAAEELPEDIRPLAAINAMSYSTEFFSAFIDKLLSWME
ncbi:tetratricopeptide repeat protein [bacterium]|nr:tetratricopeptide repeat protein [bacterium]